MISGRRPFAPTQSSTELSRPVPPVRVPLSLALLQLGGGRAPKNVVIVHHATNQLSLADVKPSTKAALRTVQKSPAFHSNERPRKE
jgi:hypothetical protein